MVENMSSRMEKYNNLSPQNMSRTKRNEHIYNSNDLGDISRIRTNNNVSIISDATKEINLDKIKNYIYSQEEKEEKRKRISLELPPEEEIKVQKREEKDYDINTVLERARGKREIAYEEERHRKIDSQNMDILKNIKIKQEENFLDDDITGPIEELNTEEKTIVDLIKNIQNNNKKKELFEDLMGEDNDTVVVGPMEENIEKNEIREALLNITQKLETKKEPETDFTQEIRAKMKELKEIDNYETDGSSEPKITTVDTSFYTNSLAFNKKDFEGFDELEEAAKKSNIAAKIGVIIVIVVLLETLLLIFNYIFDWNLI